MGFRLGSIQSYYFDRGLYTFCTRVEADMDRAENTVTNPSLRAIARQRVFDYYIKPKVAVTQFKDPAIGFKKPEKANEVVVGGISG